MQNERSESSYEDCSSSSEEEPKFDRVEESPIQPLQPEQDHAQEQKDKQINEQMNSNEQISYFELWREIPANCKDLKLKKFFETTTSADGSKRRHLRIQINDESREEEYERWREFLSSISIIHCQNFDISNNKFQNIIPSIRHISFSQLKDLSLYNNQIASIDDLHYCNLQALENLRLDNNNLIYLQGLRKCRLLSLQQIDLENNHIRDFTPLMLLEAPKLVVIRLEDWAEIPPTNDDKRWLVRIASPHLNYLRCPNPRRMRQLLIDRKLLTRFPKLNVMRCNRNSGPQ